MNTFIFTAGNKDEVMARVLRFVDRLPDGKRFKLTIEPHKRKRSNQQNAYLWGVCYRTILDTELLEGWTADDLHEFFLGEHFGWQRMEGFGRARVKPVRRSSKLSTTEFMDFVDFIQRFMAEKGVYIPDPNEEWEAA